MRWTSYLEDCLCLLQETKEYSTDILLVNLVKVQLIDNKAVETTSNPISGAAEMLPPNLFTRILTSNLDDLKRSIPTDLVSNGKISFVLLAAHFPKNPGDHITLWYLKVFQSLAGNTFRSLKFVRR